MDTKTKPTPDNAYSIGAVARLTGISTHALRIWERRYSTVIAARTDTGRRIYSRRDVEKLSLLKLLVDQGFSIGQIAGLTLDELRVRHAEVAEQVTTMQDLATGQTLTVAALAGFSVSRLRHVTIPESIDFIVLESDYSRYRADVKRQSPDVLLLEFSVIDGECLRRIADLRSIVSGARIVVLFNFAHPQEIAELAAAKVELIRSPAGLDSLLTTLLSGGRIAQPPGKAVFGQNEADPALRLLEEDIPPRRFSEAELASMIKVRSVVACECPKHLSELVQSLASFEVYSEQCENRDDKDAALHRYLHGAAARARSIMEEALATLIVEDDIKLAD